MEQTRRQMDSTEHGSTAHAECGRNTTAGFTRAQGAYGSCSLHMNAQESRWQRGMHGIRRRVSQPPKNENYCSTMPDSFWGVGLTIFHVLKRHHHLLSWTFMNIPVSRSFKSGSWCPPTAFVILSAGLRLWGTHLGRPLHTFKLSLIMAVSSALLSSSPWLCSEFKASNRLLVSITQMLRGSTKFLESIAMTVAIRFTRSG